MAGFGLVTVNDVLVRATGRGSKEVMRWQDGSGQWVPISSDELYGWVRAVADKLLGWGVKKGDRVVLLSENRWEWQVTDFACLAIGAVDAPLYATEGAERVGYMVRDSGARVAVVSSRAQYEKLAAAGDLPDLEHVLVMDAGKFDNADSFSSLAEGAKQKQGKDGAFDAMVRAAKPDDLMTIIYTSGTTGDPKGVRLTHANLASNIEQAIPKFNLTAADRIISYLPLSHVFERHVDYAFLEIGSLVAYCPKFESLPKAMQAIKPTFFVGVPRVYEKIRQGVESKSAQSPVKHAIFKWAMGVGKQHREEVLAGKKPGSLAWKIANKLVFSKIMEAFGGCAWQFVSGSAPLGMDSAGWFADVGVRIYEGYGLTETSAVVELQSAG